MGIFANATKPTARKALHLVGLATFAGSLLLNTALPAAAAALLLAPLSRTGGEDPSVSTVYPAFGEALLTVDGRVRVSLDLLDPARYPAGPACSAEVKAGSINAKGVQLTLIPADDLENPTGVEVTGLDIRQFGGTAAAGQKAQVRIRCQFVGANGIQQRHETQWSGVFATPVEVD